MMHSGLRGPQRRADPGHAGPDGEAAPAAGASASRTTTSAASTTTSPSSSARWSTSSAAALDEPPAGRRRVRRRPPQGGHRRRGRPSAAWSSTSSRPTSPAWCKELSEHDFTSSEAREKFEELIDQLREQLAQRWFNQMAGAMSDVSPEALARIKDMLAELNQMLEHRAAGQEPDFDGFMERFGDFFPENPREPRRAARGHGPAHGGHAGDAQLDDARAAGAAPGALRAAARGHGPPLADGPASANLQQAFPDMGWNRRYDFEGQDPLGFAEAAEIMNELGDLDQLEQLMRGAANPGALAEVDIDRARELLGRRGGRQPREDGRAGQDARGGRPHREPGGPLRAHARRAPPHRQARPQRPVLQAGPRQARPARADPHRPRPRAVAWTPSPTSSATRSTSTSSAPSATPSARQGGGTPVRLSPDDFEIERTEQTTRSATVLMVDLSLSMPMRDNFLPPRRWPWRCTR